MSPPKRFLPYEDRAALGLLAPLTFVLMAVTVFPILSSLWIRFFALNLRRPNRVPFVGLDNYLAVLGDQQFLDSVGRTTIFSIAWAVAVSVIATLAALLLDQDFGGRRFLSACLLIPWAITSVANGLMWKWIHDSNYGALNGVLPQAAVAHHVARVARLGAWVLITEAWYYVETFRNLSFGTGAAMSYILAIATLAMSYGLIRALAQRV